MVAWFQRLFEALNRDGLSTFLLRSISGTFALNIIGRLLSFVLMVLLARLLGVQDFGYYVLAWSWTQLLMVFGKFGSDATASKYLAAYKAQEEWTLFRGHLFYGTLKVLIKSTVLSLGACLVIYILREKLGAAQSLTFWLMMMALPFFTLTHFVQAALRVMGRPVRGIFSNTVLRPALHVLLVGGFYLFGISADAPVAAMTCAVAAISSLALAAYWLDEQLKPLPVTETREYEAKEWYGYALYILLIAGGDMVFRQTDTIMLGALMGADNAGLYGAASRIAYFVIFGVSAANFVITPLISEFHTTEEKQKLQRMVTYATRLIFALSLSIAVVILAGGGIILKLFGQEFVVVRTTLNILVIAQLITTMFGPVGSLMIMTGHEKTTAKIFLVTALINIALNLLLIPKFGIEGAALATAAAFIFWNLVTFFYVKMTLGLNPTIFCAVKRGGDVG